jgi:Zn finger protein HypA/HybF involved in hydrogenase expression
VAGALPRTVRCPDCGLQVAVPVGVGAGERFECPNCAGIFLRIVQGGDGEALAERVHVVTCPACEREIELAPGASAGDGVRCCGVDWRLTYAFGSYALEP